MIAPEDHYKVIYFEALDTVIAQIKNRFEQEGYQMYSKLEQLLQKKCCVDEVLDFYGDDFIRDDLLAQLDNFHANHSVDSSATIHDFVLVVQTMSRGEKALLEVVKLVCLILVLPSTNAVSERSFSAMRRTKNYLRTTMTQQSLIIHKFYTDKINWMCCWK